jgi:glucan 1,3-beta-glucosidase
VYEEFNNSQVVNVKEVASHPVFGDGAADDTASIQAFLNVSVGNVLYFPYGIHLLIDTILVPPDSRLVRSAFRLLRSSAHIKVSRVQVVL